MAPVTPCRLDGITYDSTRGAEKKECVKNARNQKENHISCEGENSYRDWNRRGTG